MFLAIDNTPAIQFKDVQKVYTNGHIALDNVNFDIYSEYTGTGLVNILKMPVIADPTSSFQKVKTEFYERWKLIWLEPFGFNNTYTLTMRKEHAQQLKIKSISDLKSFFEKIK